MVERNVNISKLVAGYLFPEINRRKKRLLEHEPDANIISLGIGNTTQPLPNPIAESLKDVSESLGTKDGYSGYGDEQGLTSLREKIAEIVYEDEVEACEVFISDGAKCDIGRLQLLFGGKVRVCVQDPSYPVYVDGSVIMGASGGFDENRGQYTGIDYLACTPENGFFPEIGDIPQADILYFCSPNNPTGAVADKKYLKQLVDCCIDKQMILVFDAAYSEFIRDTDLPKSIYEIDKAEQVAIEVNSFSKRVGFTGVRLGWTVVPKKLRYNDGSPVNADWDRVMATVFNGASNIAQKGGLAALSDEGLSGMKNLIDYYMENSKAIKEGLQDMDVKTYGGDNAPYVWAHYPGRKSWDVFSEILEKCHVVTTPGSGFGPAGEGFVRYSAFGERDLVDEAMSRLKKL